MQPRRPHHSYLGKTFSQRWWNIRVHPAAHFQHSELLAAAHTAAIQHATQHRNSHPPIAVQFYQHLGLFFIWHTMHRPSIYIDPKASLHGRFPSAYSFVSHLLRAHHRSHSTVLLPRLTFIHGCYGTPYSRVDAAMSSRSPQSCRSRRPGVGNRMDRKI